MQVTAARPRSSEVHAQAPLLTPARKRDSKGRKCRPDIEDRPGYSVTKPLGHMPSRRRTVRSRSGHACILCLRSASSMSGPHEARRRDSDNTINRIHFAATGQRLCTTRPGMRRVCDADRAAVSKNPALRWRRIPCPEIPTHCPRAIRNRRSSRIDVVPMETIDRSECRAIRV
jgi:hypothetical protein